ncbi:MAG: sodium/proline symporter [Oscillospiraceae bacterium]|nr:sodium/proline symporter [Oscillospiraceae bacterium]
MNLSELIMFVLYILLMLGIGIYFFMRSKSTGEKDYFLGGRQMGAWVSGLSAGASDMSAWVLMGLPASIFAAGLGKSWIAIGLFIGYALSWILVAPRLRSFSVVCGDSITIPQFLTNRFLSKNRSLQVISAVIFLVAYTVYAASSIKACGTLFHTVLGVDPRPAMYVAAIIIIGYTFLGGFNAVCWTDFFQGMLMLGALLIVPIIATLTLGGSGSDSVPAEYFTLFTNMQDVISGLGWGLGYFGMPHIIIRFMSIKSQKELKKASCIGICWNFLILTFSVLVGVVGRRVMNEGIDGSIVFITMVRSIFSGPVLGLISGLLLSAILAGAMSTADSQLLAASSAFASDVYKPLIRKGKSTDREMLWAGRWVVLAIAAVALMIAADPDSGTIMNLVENAWGIFGAAFGPVILLSLYWKRMTFSGAAAGVVVGAAVDVLWLMFLSSTGIYEIIPGFFAGLLACVFVSLSGRTDSAVEKLFDKCVAYKD